MYHVMGGWHDWYDRKYKKTKEKKKKKKKKKKELKVSVFSELQFIPLFAIIEMDGEGIRERVKLASSTKFVPFNDVKEAEHCKKLKMSHFSEFYFFSKTKEIQADDEEIITAFLMSLE